MEEKILIELDNWSKGLIEEANAMTMSRSEKIEVDDEKTYVSVYTLLSCIDDLLSYVRVQNEEIIELKDRCNYDNYIS